MSNELTVLILTHNEEENIPQCLDSVIGWADRIIIVDSGSTDSTLEIVSAYDVELVHNNFVNFAKQRNFAIQLLDSSYKGWVLFLDADEYLTKEIKSEIKIKTINSSYSGYFLNRKFYWGDTWIKRGYYPCHIIRLFRSGHGKCEDRSVNEHLIIEGDVGYIANEFIHKCNKPISHWLIKHIKRAELEANELESVHNKKIQARLFNSSVETKRWVRKNIWEKLPIFIRPFLLFFYRILLRGGIFDGRHALGYHFLQTLWFTMLIDIFYLEKKISSRVKK